MRFIILFIVLVFSGCAQLLNGQQQPVKYLKDNMMLTTCGGAVETWGSCNNRAMSKCVNGYDTIRKDEDSNGMVRELTFQCKK